MLAVGGGDRLGDLEICTDSRSNLQFAFVGSKVGEGEKRGRARAKLAEKPVPTRVPATQSAFTSHPVGSSVHLQGIA